MADQGTGLRVVLVMMVFLATSIFQTQGIIDLNTQQMTPPGASQGQFPWQVLVEAYKIVGVGQIARATCGASIIDEKWIMSAAHCYVENKKDKEGKPDGFAIDAYNITLYAGIINKTDKNGANVQKREYNEEEIKATGKDRLVFIHEQYNKEKEDNNDIALFKLKQPLVLSDYVSKIKLATTADFIPKKKLTASGWGSMTITGTPIYPDDLRYVEGLRLATMDFCFDNINTFTNTEICQVTKGKATYIGDSGGPVITGERDSNGPPYVQIGIISTAYKRPFHEDLLISVYTDVAKFDCWISEIKRNAEKPSPDCRTPGQTPGNCMVLYCCKVIFDQLQNSPSAQVITNVKNSICRFEKLTPIICCPIEEESTTT